MEDPEVTKPRSHPSTLVASKDKSMDYESLGGMQVDEAPGVTSIGDVAPWGKNSEDMIVI